MRGRTKWKNGGEREREPHQNEARRRRHEDHLPGRARASVTGRPCGRRGSPVLGHGAAVRARRLPQKRRGSSWLRARAHLPGQAIEIDVAARAPASRRWPSPASPRNSSVSTAARATAELGSTINPGSAPESRRMAAVRFLVGDRDHPPDPVAHEGPQVRSPRPVRSPSATVRGSVLREDAAPPPRAAKADCALRFAGEHADAQ